MITKKSTLKMSHPEWLAERQQGIGGSDAGTICGYNPYKSAYALWAEKCGLVEAPDLSNNEAVRQGTDLEEYVAKRFAEKYNLKVKRCNAIIKNSDYPWALANIDREIVGKKWGLECKTTTSWDIIQGCEEGNPPLHYYCQCMHYMMVTGYTKWYLAILALGRGFYVFEINYNKEDIDSLAELEKEFWDRVVKNDPPLVDGSESTGAAIKSIFAESTNDNSMDLSPIQSQLMARSQLKKQIGELQRQMDECDQEIMLYMGDHSKGSCSGYSVSWKTQQRKTFDRKAAIAKHPDLDREEFYNVSFSRPFKVVAKNG